MGFWLSVAKWTVGALGSAATGAMAATGFGIPAAAVMATWTATMTTMLAIASAEEDNQAKRAEELKESTENANASKDLNNILDQAFGGITKAKELRNKEEITAEEQKDALEHLSQAYIKVAGIELSVNPHKNEATIVERVNEIKDTIAQERIAWRAKLHDDYNFDMATTTADIVEKKQKLNLLYDEVRGDGEEAQALRTNLKAAIDFLDSKVAPEHQEFVDERRKEVEALKILKGEHEEAFNKAKESVKNNAVTGVEDAEKALEKRAEFDSKFKELLDTFRSKQADLPHVITPDILYAIVDFYGVFRDPELLHNEVFANAYQQQAERNEQVVFATPLEANSKATWHLKRSVALYEIYEDYIKKNEYALARKLRFQVEAHQREAARIAGQLPAKFSVWKSGKIKDWLSELSRLAVKYSKPKNLEDWGKSLKDQINAHGDEIHKAMHLADLGEDDFYRSGLKATERYFVANKQMSDDISTLIEETENKIPTLDARERSVAKAEVDRSEVREQEDRIKAEEVKSQAQVLQQEQEQEKEDLGLDLPSVPTAPIVFSKIQEPLQGGTEGQASETEQQAKEETETNVSEDVYHNSYPTSSMPSGELSVQAEKQLVSAEEANFTPLTSAQKAEKKAQETSDRIINEQYRRAVKANIARQEQRSKKDRERWAKLSKEEISKKFNLIYELFSTKAVSTPELLFDGDLTVLDHLIMNDVVDQEKWKEITDVWKGMELSPQDKWDSLSLHFKWQAVFAYDSGYGRIYSFLTTCEKLKLSREQLEEAFWEEHKLSLERELSEQSRKFEVHRGHKYYEVSQEEQSVQPDDESVLSEDLLKRFAKLREVKHVSEEDSKPRIEAEKPKVLKPITYPVVSPQEKVIPEVIDQQYQQALVEREELLTSVEDDADVRVYAVSRKDGQLVQRLLKKGEKPLAHEGTAYGYDCSIRLPPIDTGDAFNNFSGKKIRIFKGSIKVINTSDVEVGVYGEDMHPIEELRGSPKTGEFTFPIYSDAQHLPELVIRHKGESSHFHLTSVTTHFTVED